MNPIGRGFVHGGMMRVGPIGLFFVAVFVPAMAEAQPCGGYAAVSVGEELLERWIDELGEADEVGADDEAPPDERLAAYHRAAELAQEIGDAYSTCDVPSERDETRFREATGRSLSGWWDWRKEAWKTCAEVVARTHASGEEARTCVREGPAPLRPLAPEPPAAWVDADANDGAGLCDELRKELDESDVAVRTDLAAICLAAGDWEGALELAQPLSGTYEGDLLRAAAMAGQGEGSRAARVYRGLVSRDPGRPEAHFNLALLAAARWSWPRRGPAALRAPFLHALAYLCLTDPEDDPELATDATEFARNLEEALNGRSAWIWRGGEEQPPLPLPVSELGPEEQGHPADTPYARTCEEVLRESAPGFLRESGEDSE